jgi:hypothetical protein
MTSPNPDHLPKAPPPNVNTINMGLWGRFSTHELLGDTFNPSNDPPKMVQAG